MKIFILQELDWVYNDEYFHRGDHEDSDAGLPQKAFRKKEYALAECDKLNGERTRENRDSRYPMTDSEDKGVTEWYRVVEVEVADEDVESYAEACAKQKEAFEKANSLLRDALLKGAAEVFEKFPRLESFGWTAYTDYFNDGSPCTFHIDAEEPYLNGSRSYDMGKDEAEAWGEAAAGQVAGLVYAFSRDHMESAFGDHVKVTINRDGTVETGDYSDHG